MRFLIGYLTGVGMLIFCTLCDFASWAEVLIGVLVSISMFLLTEKMFDS